MTDTASRYADILRQIRESAHASNRTAPQLLAVSKAKPAAAIRELAALGQRAFGENYLQEALDKMRELGDLSLEWHFIGHLQSRKCDDIARHFDWLHSLDRPKLIERLDGARPPEMGPLNVLIQVNIDAEASKSGCAPGQIASLAERVANARGLRLRGLMAIPEPSDPNQLRSRFASMRQLLDELAIHHDGIDTLSMGMSGDFALAIAEGTTMLRIGTALFGDRQ